MNKPPEIIPTEYQEQGNLFKWAKMMESKHPELWLLNGSLNGVRLHIGSRIKMKRAGMKAGFPDISLPVARGRYHGLYIELKRVKGGVVSPEQREWHYRLKIEDYRVEVCYGWVEAGRIIAEYLGLI